MKKLFLVLHRWFGLTAGFYYVLLGLSGSYIVYRPEIDRWIQSDLYRSESEVPAISIQKAVAAAQAGLGTRNPPMSINASESAGANVTLSFNVASPDEPRRIATAFVDPTRYEFKGSTVFEDTASGKIFFFHHDLFLGATGRTIMAICGFFMLAILATGLWLWLPKRGAIRHALAWPKPRNFRHWNLEFHKFTGIYTLVLMISVTFSGVYISKPKWFQREERKEEKREDRKEGKPSTFDPTQISGQLVLARPIQMRIDATKLVGTDQGQKTDLKTGSFLPAGPPTGNPMQKFQRDLHGGHYWGWLGRLLVFFSGLVPLFFYITGINLWRKKAAAT